MKQINKVAFFLLATALSQPAHASIDCLLELILNCFGKCCQKQLDEASKPEEDTQEETVTEAMDMAKKQEDQEKNPSHTNLQTLNQHSDM